MDSPPHPADPTDLAALVAAAAARVPDHPAVVDVTGPTTLTWAELDAAGSAEAARLVAAGVAPGDRVAVRLPNGAACCVALLGAWRAGATAVPLGPETGRAELATVLADCRPAVLVAAADDEVAAAAGAPSLLDPPDPAARAEPAREPVPVPVPAAGEALALLLYTSGGTGVPRGVQLPHRAVLANREQAAALRPAPITPVDRVLLALPLFHAYGLGAGFLQVCWAGATVVLGRRFTPERLVEVLVEQRVSTLAGVPSTFRGLLELPAQRLRAATAGLRLCTSGGAPLPPRDLAAFRARTGLSIVEGYGLTEAGPVVTSNPIDGAPKPGSVGRPLPGIELRLVDPDPATETVDPLPVEIPDVVDSEAGEDDSEPGDGTGLVAIRGANLFSGYWPDGAGGPDPDGWFRTSDLGFLDADGDLHLVDRSSDLVVVNGFTVYPHEVEQVLLGHPGVAEAAVVGVADPASGQAVRAVLVRAADTAGAGADVEADSETDPGAGAPAGSGAGPSVDDVRAYCVERLARFKVPTIIDFVPALPRTPTGKVARRQLAREGS